MTTKKGSEPITRDDIEYVVISFSRFYHRFIHLCFSKEVLDSNSELEDAIMELERTLQDYVEDCLKELELDTCKKGNILEEYSCASLMDFSIAFRYALEKIGKISAFEMDILTPYNKATQKDLTSENFVEYASKVKTSLVREVARNITDKNSSTRCFVTLAPPNTTTSVVFADKTNVLTIDANE